jgi:hypothetical protein
LIVTWYRLCNAGDVRMLRFDPKPAPTAPEFRCSNPRDSRVASYPGSGPNASAPHNIAVLDGEMLSDQSHASAAMEICDTGVTEAVASKYEGILTRPERPQH